MLNKWELYLIAIKTNTIYAIIRLWMRTKNMLRHFLIDLQIILKNRSTGNISNVCIILFQCIEHITLLHSGMKRQCLLSKATKLCVWIRQLHFYRSSKRSKICEEFHPEWLFFQLFGRTPSSVDSRVFAFKDATDTESSFQVFCVFVSVHMMHIVVVSSWTLKLKQETSTETEQGNKLQKGL